MSNYFDQYDEPAEPSGGGGGGNYFDQFDPPPRQQQAAPQQQQAAPQENYFDQFDPPPQRQQREAPPEAEGQFGAGVRQFLHDVPSALGGIAGGALAGGAAGLAGGPIGAIAGAIGGGFAGGYAGGKAAEVGLDLIGFDDSQQLAVNAAAHPWTTAAASAGTMVLGGGIGGASRLARGVGAGLGGGIEAGRQYLSDEEFSPAKLAANVAGGAAFARPYEWTNKISARGAQLAEGYRGPPSSNSNPGPTASSSVAEPMTSPSKNAAAEAAVGDPHNKPTGSEKDYSKPPDTETGDHAGTQILTDYNPIDATLKTALDAENIQTRVDPNGPTQYGAKLDAEFPRVPPQEGVTPGPPATPVTEPPQGRLPTEEPTPPPAMAAARPDEVMRGPAPPAEEGIPDFLRRGPDNKLAAPPVEAPPPVEMPAPTPVSDQLKTANAASKEFRKAQADYRARRIGDEEFLAAKAKHDAASRTFDESRGEAPPAAEPTPPQGDPPGTVRGKEHYTVPGDRDALGQPIKHRYREEREAEIAKADKEIARLEQRLKTVEATGRDPRVKGWRGEAEAAVPRLQNDISQVQGRLNSLTRLRDAALPRNAVEVQPTIGDKLKGFLGDEGGGGRIGKGKKPVVESTEPNAAPIKIFKNEAGQHFLVQGDKVISSHKNMGQAFIALNKAQRAAGVSTEPVPSSTEPVAPTAAQQAALETAATAAPRGQPAKMSPTGGQKPPPVTPPAAGGGGTPPIPPTVGQAAAAGGGGGPPPPPNPGHIPPKQRGHWEELWRDVKRKLAPQTLGPDAAEAKTQVRGSYGETERVAAQSKNLVQKHAETIEPMSDADRWALINHAQGGDSFPNFKPTPEQKAYIQDRERAMQEWEAQLHTLSDADKMQFRKDYMAQMYKNPDIAPNRIYGGSGKRGSTGSTKHRFYENYEEAKAAGLEPFSNNPIEIDTRYINSIQNFVASRRLLQRGQDSGHIGFFESPKVKGASGSPEPLIEGGPPPDWKKLESVPDRNGRVAYASPDYADVFNNFYDKGLKTNDNRAGIYDTVRNSTNAWTQLELGLNGYHPFTMANEAIITDLTKGFNNILGGQFAKGAKQIAKSPLAPVTMAKEGKIFQQEYLNPNSTNPIAAILAEANARPVGRDHAADYTFQDRGAFIKQWSPQKIAEQLKQAGREVSEDFGKAFGADGKVSDKVMFPLRQVGRVLQTTAGPIFDKYIPLLKAGAVSSQMKDWHEAMLLKNPQFDMINNPADRKTAVNAAMKIVDSVDNRFGEAIHDNAFTNQTIKQVAVAGMRSYSWATGAIKEIGGGTYSAGRALGKLATSKGAENRFDMTHPDWDPRMVYPLGLTMAVGTISTLYQFLATGEGPEGWRDIYAPKTGGKVPGVGGRGEVPEHVLMPGYQKDVLGWLTHPGQEAYNKIGGLPTTLIEQASGKDWRGDAIVKPGSTAIDAFGQRMAHFFGKMSPISVKNMTKGAEPDSAIPGWQKAIGFRAPGAFIQDPEGLNRAMTAKENRAWKAKERRERKIELRQNP